MERGKRSSDDAVTSRPLAMGGPGGKPVPPPPPINEPPPPPPSVPAPPTPVAGNVTGGAGSPFPKKAFAANMSPKQLAAAALASYPTAPVASSALMGPQAGSGAGAGPGHGSSAASAAAQAGVNASGSAPLIRIVSGGAASEGGASISAAR